jgi:hypothetical protein
MFSQLSICELSQARPDQEKNKKGGKYAENETTSSALINEKGEYSLCRGFHNIQEQPPRSFRNRRSPLSHQTYL